MDVVILSIQLNIKSMATALVSFIEDKLDNGRPLGEDAAAYVAVSYSQLLNTEKPYNKSKLMSNRWEDNLEDILEDLIKLIVENSETKPKKFKQYSTKESQQQQPPQQQQQPQQQQPQQQQFQCRWGQQQQQPQQQQPPQQPQQQQFQCRWGQQQQQPQIQCRWGQKCRFLKAGTCKYFHSTLSSGAQKKQTNQCRWGINCRYKDTNTCKYDHSSDSKDFKTLGFKSNSADPRGSISCKFGQSCRNLPLGKCPFDHSNCSDVEANFIKTARTFTNYNSDHMNSMSLEPCKWGTSCQYYLTDSCRYAH